jgi:hypothetical protein
MMKNYLKEIKVQKQNRANKLAAMSLAESISIMESLQSGIAMFKDFFVSSDKPAALKIQLDLIKKNAHRI